MKLTKKFAGALLLGLTTVMLAAVPASAAPELKYEDERAIKLYKTDAKEGCDQYWAIDPADSIIPMANLKWNAKISDIQVKRKGHSWAKVCIGGRRTGTYCLQIRANKNIKPGNEVWVKWTVKQYGKYHNCETKLTFVEGDTPFAYVQLGEADLAGQFVGHRSYKYDKDDFGGYKAEDLLPFTVKCRSPYKRTKVYIYNKNGVARRFTNGNRVNFDNVSKIVINFEEPKDVAPKYFKEESCSYPSDCTKLFPVKEHVTIYF
jgi:hypothetical protein